jgi:hypothetical protein
MSCPPYHALDRGRCVPFGALAALPYYSAGIGAPGQSCTIPSGAYGILDAAGNCGPMHPGQIGPCKVDNGAMGYIDANGYCVTALGLGGGDKSPNAPCDGGVIDLNGNCVKQPPCVAGLVPYAGLCWCPDLTPPKAPPGSPYEQKCPSAATKKGCPECKCPGCPECKCGPCQPGQPCPPCPECQCGACPPVTEKTAAEPEPVRLWPWLVGGTALGLFAGFLAFGRNEE